MPVRIEPVSGIAFLAFPEMMQFLETEISARNLCSGNESAGAVKYGDLLYYPEYSAEKLPFWAKNVLMQPFFLHFDSITEAGNALRDIQRNWAPYLFTQFRRGTLIQEKMPYINLKERTFPCEIPRSPIGIYTLLDEHTIFASSLTTSFLPAGNIAFQEDHENPPSRAYLKLQEALARMPLLFPDVKLPQKGTRCFDAGAAPGGWTYVLRKLGCYIFAVDRAELAAPFMNDRHVTFLKHDAFTLRPDELEQFDWVFSDVVCYPDRLYEWIRMWLESDRRCNMICTVKMQGETDFAQLEKFAAIPDSALLHLNYNKHEFTWFYYNKLAGVGDAETAG